MVGVGVEVERKARSTVLRSTNYNCFYSGILFLNRIWFPDSSFTIHQLLLSKESGARNDKTLQPPICHQTLSLHCLINCFTTSGTGGSGTSRCKTLGECTSTVFITLNV